VSASLPRAATWRWEGPLSGDIGIVAVFIGLIRVVLVERSLVGSGFPAPGVYVLFHQRIQDDRPFGAWYAQ
jgi:hypothetical protein